MPSVEANSSGRTLRASLATAIAPVTWGSTYFVTQEFLPADRPLFGAVVRALPAGLLLLAWRRRLPRGDWWWRSLVIATLTIGAFFALLFVVAERLPSSLGSVLMATSPVVMMLLAWGLVGERPRPVALAGALAGFLGVGLLVGRADGGLDVVGIVASLSAMVLSSVGYVLTQRWRPPVDTVTFCSWQLTMGGLVLVPFAAFVEGSPPSLGTSEVVAFAYVSLIATALAYVGWNTGLKHLSAGTVSLIGLLNPVVGVLLGVALAGEHFGPAQVVGMALVLLGVLAGQPAVWRRFRRADPRSIRLDSAL